MAVSESALELISRAAPSVEAHHLSVGPDFACMFDYSVDQYNNVQKQ